MLLALIAAVGAYLLYKGIKGNKDNEDIRKAVDYAYNHETNPNLLITLAQKLKAAGYENEANLLLAKAERLKAPQPLPYSPQIAAPITTFAPSTGQQAFKSISRTSPVYATVSSGLVSIAPNIHDPNGYYEKY